MGGVIQVQAIQVHKELTRPQVAALLTPKVSVKQLQAYLHIARKYVPEFKKFTDRRTGRLKGLAKLYESHIPVLQEIRSLARENTLAEIEYEFQQRASKSQFSRRQEAEGRGQKESIGREL